MAIQFHSTGTSSRPERKEVTADLERRFREQEAAKQAVESAKKADGNGRVS